jgi:hypothetical protein
VGLDTAVADPAPDAIVNCTIVPVDPLLTGVTAGLSVL